MEFIGYDGNQMSIENQQFGVCWSTSIDHQILGCRVIEDNPRIIVLTMKHMGALIDYGWLTVEVRYQNLSFRGICSSGTGLTGAWALTLWQSNMAIENL